MKQKYSSAWKSSSQVRKQRKYRFNAPLHIRQEFVSCNLSKELRTKYSKRHLALRKGDTVLIKVGQFKGKSGKVEQVLLKKGVAYVSGIEVIKKNGSKVKYPLKPCNLQITSLMLEDKKRLLQTERGKSTKKEKPKAKTNLPKQAKQKVSALDKKGKLNLAKEVSIKTKSETKSETKFETKPNTQHDNSLKESSTTKSVANGNQKD